VWLNEGQDHWTIFLCGSHSNRWHLLWHVGTVCVPPDSIFAAKHHPPTGWASPTLEFACSRNPHENLPGSLDWAWRTNLLAPVFAGYHSTGFLFLGVCQGPSICYPFPDLPMLRDCTRDVIAPVTWTCWTERGKKLSIDLALFVPPVGHMLKCTKLTTVTQILWVPLSYTTNCIHLAFTVFSQWWIEMWEVWKGHPVLIRKLEHIAVNLQFPVSSWLKQHACKI
jgi:hypothetical protein